MQTDQAAPALPAADWSLSLGHFGQVSVLLALVFCLLSALLWLLSAKNPGLEKYAKWTFTLGCISFLSTCATVVALFVTDQFQFKYVFEHGSSDYELRYKIAGAWSGQEGSILLWGTTSALFGILAVRSTGPNRKWFTIAYSLFLASVAGILAFESPFVLNPLIDGRAMVPSTGHGMPPSLLNYWVVIHPPTIFSGFGSLTVLFAWAVAALVRRDLVEWIPRVRPWALVSLTLLGLGLAMGGFWAYETLGWGGFWAWDPVENTSFVPWVAVAAFLHGLFVQVSRQKWHLTNVLLAGLPFLLFCYGTFLTRSGFLGDTSVHSFAEMDHSALWILVSMIVIGYGSFLGLWFHRLATMKGKLPISKPMTVLPINREIVMGMAIWLLIGFGVVTAIGMSIPVIQSLGGHKPRVVEETLYNTVLSFLLFPFIVCMAVGPFLTWRGLGFRALFSRFVNIIAISFGLLGFVLLWIKGDFMGLPADFSATMKLFLTVSVNRVSWIMVLTWFSLFGLVATVWKLVENVRRSPSGIGGMMTHLGVGVALFGLIFSRGLEQKHEIFVIPPTRTIEAMGYNFGALGPTGSLIDHNNRIKISVTGKSGGFEIDPGLYFNGIDKNGQPMPVKWPGIHGGGLFDLYLILHDITFEATGETPLKVGEQRLSQDENLLLTYHGMRTEGPLGQKGAMFFAKVTVEAPDKKWDVEPMIKMGEGGIEDHSAPVGDKYRVKLVSINAADKSATLQILYNQPAYVAELYYKPLTLFVWLGIGIMTFGGALTAWTRRYRKGPLAEAKAAEPEPGDNSDSQEDSNAPEPTVES